MHPSYPVSSRPFSIAVGLTLTFLVGVCPSVMASEDSKILSSHGLLDFHARRYEDALTVFDEAVRADSGDVYALYYRGVTHGRLNHRMEAVHDLYVAVFMKPDFNEAALELGVALVDVGEYADAVRWLEQAQRVPALHAEASFFLGIAQLYLGDATAAEQSFAAAAEKKELETTARYYQGVADVRRREWPAARGIFGTVAAAAPNSEIGHEATAFSRQLRLWHLFGSAGFEYDSNIILAPSNDLAAAAVGVTDQSDGRAILSVGGRYIPFRTRNVQLSAGYTFFQGLQFDLTDFNLQTHSVDAELTYHLYDASLGLIGRYDYDLLHLDRFLQQGTVGPWIDIPEGYVGRLELFYRALLSDFLRRPFEETRDSVLHAVGFRQFGYLGAPDRFVVVGYTFNRQDAWHRSGDAFAFDGHAIETGVGWQVWPSLETAATYRYRHLEYDPESGGRRDDEHVVRVAVRQQLTRFLWLSCAYLGTFDNSNNVTFEYDRHVGSIALETEF